MFKWEITQHLATKSKGEESHTKVLFHMHGKTSV